MPWAPARDLLSPSAKIQRTKPRKLGAAAARVLFGAEPRKAPPTNHNPQRIGRREIKPSTSRETRSTAYVACLGRIDVPYGLAALPPPTAAKPGRHPPHSTPLIGLDESPAASIRPSRRGFFLSPRSANGQNARDCHAAPTGRPGASLACSAGAHQARRIPQWLAACLSA